MAQSSSLILYLWTHLSHSSAVSNSGELGQRQCNQDFCAAPDISDNNVAAHVVHDHFGHIQANARPLVLGGEIRIEYFRQDFFGNAASVVAN